MCSRLQDLSNHKTTKHFLLKKTKTLPQRPFLEGLHIFSKMMFLPLITIAISVLPSVMAVCCETNCMTCDDGTKGTPCCAHGRCNIFCCNCDDGCRQGNACHKRDNVFELATRSESVTAAFAAADVDGTGAVTLEQYLDYMVVEGENEAWVEWFKK